MTIQVMLTCSSASRRRPQELCGSAEFQYDRECDGNSDRRRLWAWQYRYPGRNSADNSASASATTGIPSTHLLSGSIVTNSNSSAQDMILTFVDQEHPLDASLSS